MCETETKKALPFPESVLDASVIVPETMIEYRYCLSLTSSMAKVLLWHLECQNSFTRINHFLRQSLRLLLVQYANQKLRLYIRIIYIW
jgi:hypothetical protein